VVVEVRDEVSSRADSAPQKPYRPSPVQDSKKRGFGGLLSRIAVHAARRDGEEPVAAQCYGKRLQEPVREVRSDLPFIGTGRQANRRRREMKRTVSGRRTEETAAGAERP
jgi:hypothetical protein